MYQMIQSKTTDPNSINRLPFWRGLSVLALVLTCLALAPVARAVVPAPDGAYPGFNTAEGQNALLHLAGGVWNTALGGQALLNNTTGTGNTAVGLNALFHNTDGDSNVAVGVNALLFNTTGDANIAIGQGALTSNNGIRNVAIGFQALANNTTAGNASNAVGFQALTSATTGLFNNAFGWEALNNVTIGNNNTAMGDGAGDTITSGSNNLVLGANAGGPLTTASNNIRIGVVPTPDNVSNRTYIAGIRGVACGNGNGIAVLIDSDGQLGTSASSKRFKKDIKPMDQTSAAILALKPVTFHYRGKDTEAAEREMEFGLIAEEVAEVNPDLVERDKDGRIYTVRYDAVNAMLLNEFLKEHRKVEDLQTTVAKQQKGMDALTAKLNEQAAQIQKVSAQLELKRSTPQVVSNH